jgi:hypothetical protein
LSVGIKSALNQPLILENVMNLHRTIALSAFIAGIQLPAQAASVVVDGKIADWGLHQTGKASDWTPNPALVPSTQYTVEDQTGNANTYLSPGYGGQAYDAEALYTFVENNLLYIALITGLSPDTPDNPKANSYGPGDFAIDFGQDGSYEFGIETTGANAG